MDLLRYAEPGDESQAKFSLNFGLASILLRRRAGLREYTTEFLHSEEMQRTMRKVKPIHDPDVAKMGTDKMRSIVEVELNDGRIFTTHANTARGTPEKPLREGDFYQKFRECASYSLDERKIDPLFKKIQTIEQIQDLRDLTTLLML